MGKGCVSITVLVLGTKHPTRSTLKKQGFILLPSLKEMVHHVGEGKCMWTQSMRRSQLEGKCSHACVHACVHGDIPRIALASHNSCLVGVGIPLRLTKTVWSYGTVRAALWVWEKARNHTERWEVHKRNAPWLKPACSRSLAVTGWRVWLAPAGLMLSRAIPGGQFNQPRGC